MIRVAFLEFGKTNVAFLDGKKNSKWYTDTLEQFHVSFAHEKQCEAWIYQQDNISIHIVNHTKEDGGEKDFLNGLA